MSHEARTPPAKTQLYDYRKRTIRLVGCSDWFGFFRWRDSLQLLNRGNRPRLQSSRRGSLARLEDNQGLLGSRHNRDAGRMGKGFDGAKGRVE